MNADSISFSQKSGFTKHQWQIQGNKIKLCFTSPFKRREVAFNLEDIDEHSEQVTHQAYGWLSFLILFCLASIVHFCLTIFKPQWSSHWSGGLFLLLVAMIALCGYKSCAINRLTYYTLTKQRAFSLRVNHPDYAAFNTFVTRLNMMLILLRKRKELASVIQNFPTDFLKEEFALFYTEELLRRGIDIHQLLSSVKKECLLTYVLDPMGGRVLN